MDACLLLLRFSFSVLSQEIGWEERLRNDLFVSGGTSNLNSINQSGSPSQLFVSGPCARLSWPSRQLLSARKSTVSYRIVLYVPVAVSVKEQAAQRFFVRLVLLENVSS